MPFAVGLNTTLIEQPAPGARDVPQLFVWVKSPLNVKPMVSAAVPVLLKVIVCAALGVPTAWAAKVSD
jgi:hypothetical protein